MARHQGSAILEERSVLLSRCCSGLFRGGIVFFGAHTLLVVLALALAGSI